MLKLKKKKERREEKKKYKVLTKDEARALYNKYV